MKIYISKRVKGRTSGVWKREVWDFIFLDEGAVLLEENDTLNRSFSCRNLLKGFFYSPVGKNDHNITCKLLKGLMVEPVTHIVLASFDMYGFEKSRFRIR